MAKESAMTAVDWRGVQITARQRDAVRWAERQVQKKHPNVTFLPAQGSWRGDVEASGSTHDGAGALDIRTVMYSDDALKREMVRQLRNAGQAAWFRPKNWDGDGGGEHIHMIDRVPNGESSSARGQVRDFDKGLNGLSNKGKDPLPYRPNPKVRWSYPLGKPVPA